MGVCLHDYISVETSLPLRTAKASAMERTRRSDLMPAQAATGAVQQQNQRALLILLPLASACQPLAWSADGCTPGLCNAMASHKGKECRAETTLSHANCLPEYKPTRANIYDNDFYLTFDNSQTENTRITVLHFFIYFHWIH